MPTRQVARPTRKQLTPRQALFVGNLARGKTITEAARSAGYSGKNLAQSGYQVLKTVQARAPEVMVEAGLTPEVVIEKYLVPLLSATTRKVLLHKGKFMYSRPLPDWRTRAFAL